MKDFTQKQMNKRIEIDLHISDKQFGHPDYGFIDRVLIHDDPEDQAEMEDQDFAIHLKKTRPELAARHPRVRDGKLILDAE